MKDLRRLLLLSKRTRVNRRLLGAAGSVGAQRAARTSVAKALGTEQLGEARLAVAVLTVDTVLGNLELTVAVLAFEAQLVVVVASSRKTLGKVHRLAAGRAPLRHVDN